MRCRALLLLQVQKRHSDCPRITSAALQPFAVGISAAEVLGARTYCPSALAGEPALHPTQHTAFDSVAATTGGSRRASSPTSARRYHRHPMHISSPCCDVT